MTRRLIPFIALSLMVLTCLLGWYTVRTDGVAGAANSGIVHYTCPMHPRYTSDKPGDCPSCGMRLVPVYAEDRRPTGDEKDASLPPGALSISFERQQIIGVRTDPVEKVAIEHRMRTVGRVVADETKIVRLTAADGWVEEVYAGSADSVVQKDQLLAKFYSKEFIAAELSYLYSVDIPDRVSKERQDKSVSYIQARSADKELRSLGMSDYQMKEIARTRQAVTEIELRAPITGFVLARNINPGMKFDRGSELYRIADLSHVWILADVFENEAAYFRPGTEAKVTLGQQGRILQARVSGVLPQFDPTSRTLKMRLEADNPGYVLRPDMFVDVEIPIHRPPAVVVQSEAILDTGGKQRVFVDLGNGHFAPREVKTGARFGDKTEIVAGLTAGERIVTSGTFLIDSESRMRAAAAGDSDKPVKDPVCGMDVDPKAAEATTQHGGKTYYFCSPKCKKDFEEDPGKYVHERVADQDTNKARDY
jgi:Cu(I)/Ag(I) efflux system membrane fusion protein